VIDPGDSDRGWAEAEDEAEGGSLSGETVKPSIPPEARSQFHPLTPASVPCVGSGEYCATVDAEG
jgi:hypothetical protein